MDMPSISGPVTKARPAPDPLLAAAQELEASFLAEMLKAAGLGTARQSFGGGAGEDQFASFLVQEHARAIVQAGGIGLTQSIFEAIKENPHAATGE